jgi:hypothetical protein
MLVANKLPTCLPHVYHSRVVFPATDKLPEATIPVRLLHSVTMHL